MPNGELGEIPTMEEISELWNKRYTEQELEELKANFIQFKLFLDSLYEQN